MIQQEEKTCPDCENPVDDEGMSLVYCDWSHDTPPICETCRFDPCDGSC